MNLDEHEHRHYWTQCMEDAYAFMERMLVYPVMENREGLASIGQAALENGVRIDLPSGLKMGRYPRDFRVRHSLVRPLLNAAEDFLRQAWVLRVEDAFRDIDVQMRGARSERIFQTVYDMARWECGGGEPTAELILRRLSVYTAITPKFANHTAGSAVDVGVTDMNGYPVDLGGTYPELSRTTPMASPFVSNTVRRNRETLCHILKNHGFHPYPFEFWHFSSGDADAAIATGATAPAHFGPVRAVGSSGQVVPVDDPLMPLVCLGDIARHLASAAAP